MIKKIVPCIFVMVHCWTMIGTMPQQYTHKTVETVDERKPHASYLAVRNTKVHITNKSGHAVKNVKLIFKFVGRRGLLHHRYVYGDSLLGEVTIKNLNNYDTVTIRPTQAHDVENQPRIPAEEFAQIENVTVLCLSKDMYTYHLHKTGIQENHFMISRFGDHDVIETKKHYKDRVSKIRPPKRNRRGQEA